MLARHPFDEDFMRDQAWQQQISNLFKGSLVLYTNNPSNKKKSVFTAGASSSDPYISLAQAITHPRLTVYSINIKNTKLMELLK